MIEIPNDKFYLLTTRFNNYTFNENKIFKQKHNFEGCIYNVPQEISPKIPILSKVFVFEMNNEENKIMGIGYLKNKPNFRKRRIIYSDNNYNRYSYIGKYRIDRKELYKDEKEFLKIIEDLVFKGSDHIKRGQGFISIPEKKINKICKIKKHFKKELLNFLINIFLDKYL